MATVPELNECACLSTGLVRPSLSGRYLARGVWLCNKTREKNMSHRSSLQVKDALLQYISEDIKKVQNAYKISLK